MRNTTDTGGISYTPQLDPAELTAAADALASAAMRINTRAAATHTATGELAATGFAGPTASLGIERLNTFRTQLTAEGEQFDTMATALRAAAWAQQALDVAARSAEVAKFSAFTLAHHHRLIMWLNQLSRQLDSALARELNRARQVGFDPLCANPEISLDELSARHMATLPATTQHAIQSAGGLVLEAGSGSTTVLVGDTEHPQRVITLVAGATTGNPHQLADELEKAQRIAQRTGAAVVVWQGYEPPQSVGLAISPTAAHEGAGNLAAFQAALEERFPDAHKTAVAHSYGTLVATQAAHEHGLLVDDLWLLGSGGVAGESVADLTLATPDAGVYVVDADDDPIRGVRSGTRGVLGTSPSSDSYGATVIDGVSGRHSSYFTDEAFLSALSQPPAQAAQEAVASANGN